MSTLSLGLGVLEEVVISQVLLNAQQQPSIKICWKEVETCFSCCLFGTSYGISKDKPHRSKGSILGQKCITKTKWSFQWQLSLSIDILSSWSRTAPHKWMKTQPFFLVNLSNRFVLVLAVNQGSLEIKSNFTFSRFHGGHENPGEFWHNIFWEHRNRTAEESNVCTYSISRTINLPWFFRLDSTILYKQVGKI